MSVVNMYGGDETNALVFDFGTYQTKAGFSGDDAPKAVYPSFLGSSSLLDNSIDESVGPANSKGVTCSCGASKRTLYVGHQAVNYRRDNMDIISPFKNAIGPITWPPVPSSSLGSSTCPWGPQTDWEAVEALLSHSYRDRLRVAPEDFAVLATEPAGAPRAARERFVELLFERFDVPAVFLAKSPALASFAVARQSSLMVELGHAGATVAAVHDGYVLGKSVVRTRLGGALLTDAMQSAVMGASDPSSCLYREILPRYTIKRVEVRPGEFLEEKLSFPGTTSSFRQFQISNLMADCKESICRTSDVRYLEDDNARIPTLPYDLPDGHTVHIGHERFKVPEIMFQPQLLATFPHGEALMAAAAMPLAASPIATPGSLASAPTSSVNTTTPNGFTTPLPLQEAVMQAVGSCDVDLKKDLLSCVVLSGGSSLFHGVKERLEREIFDLAPSAARVKVSAPGSNLERRFSVWIGGSILGSLGTFQQMWLSKAEYQEHGASLIHRKSP
mmetsp:Transcript_19575/g.35299  ORF Transcript_19575/g.35299 Transcript_19575/m.35299 type:complete len:502 (-) Transcript_19575:360-1865(-)